MTRHYLKPRGLSCRCGSAQKISPDKNPWKSSPVRTRFLKWARLEFRKSRQRVKPRQAFIYPLGKCLVADPVPKNKTEKSSAHNFRRRKAIEETRKSHRVLESSRYCGESETPEGSWEVSVAIRVAKEGGSQKVTLQPNLKGMRKQAY